MFAPHEAIDWSVNTDQRFSTSYDERYYQFERLGIVKKNILNTQAGATLYEEVDEDTGKVSYLIVWPGGKSVRFASLPAAQEALNQFAADVDRKSRPRDEGMQR